MTDKYVRVLPGKENKYNSLYPDKIYKVSREDAYHYFITDEFGEERVWYKERFEEVLADGSSPNTSSHASFEVFSKILKENLNTIDSTNLAHLDRIDKHFQEVLKQSSIKRVGSTASMWQIESPNGTQMWTDNPVRLSLQIGNVDAKNRLIKELAILFEKSNELENSSKKETSVPPVERKKTAMEAVRMLPNNKSYVFGGFVRDHLAGEEFKDLDVYLHGSYAMQNYLAYLKNDGFHYTFLRKGSTYIPDSGMSHDVFSITKNGNEIIVDIISDPEGEHRPVPDRNWDADINQVFMRKDGSVATGFGNKSNLDQIKQKIKNKEYTPLPGLTASRQEKLAQKGYYPTGAKRPDPQKTDEKGSTNVEKQTQTQAPSAVSKPSFMDKLKVNAEDAAYRVAATQMTNGTKAAILAIMTKQGQGSERISAISEMLDTEVGGALVAGLLGLSLQYAPMVSEDPRAQRLADEFQVAGMATVGNAVVGMAMEHFVPVVMGALANLPHPTTKQMRVATREEEKVLSTPIELEDNSATQQKAVAAAR